MSFGDWHGAKSEQFCVNEAQTPVVTEYEYNKHPQSLFDEHELYSIALSQPSLFTFTNQTNQSHLYE